MLTIAGRNVTFLSKHFDLCQSRMIHHACKVLVVGGGTGGCSIAAKFARKFNNPKDVIIVEPSNVHYYQPLFTLIGGGVTDFSSCQKPMKDVLPKNAKWLQHSVTEFNPEGNKVVICNGDTIQYDILIVSMGLQLYWDKIPGLKQSLENPKFQVCSIYGPNTVTKVYDRIKQTKDGTAVFTFPNSPVKCPGAPQKIVYLAENYFRNAGVRKNIKVNYNTSLPVIFGVKKYADSLWEVCRSRDISVNLQTNLVGINPEKREATFQKLNSGETFVQEYSLLHVTPPMGPPDVLRKHTNITNEAGFLDVDKNTLRHTIYSNIYGIGDCTNTPNSKTMAAIAPQSKVVFENVLNELAGKSPSMSYNGYASCPLVTGYGKCILAEFDYNLKPMETFPINQGKEYYFMFLLKKYFFPSLYWNLMLRGLWNGPGQFRKFTNLIVNKNAEKTVATKN